MFTQESITIKQSPVVIIKNFVFFEVLAAAGFLLAGAVTYYAAIYRKFLISQTISFHLAEIIFIFAGQIVLICYIFLRWYKNYYSINKDKIIHGSGLLFKHRDVIPLESVESVSYHQGPIAKVLKYGTLDLVGTRTVNLHHIPDPQHYSDIIIDLKKSLVLSSFGAGVDQDVASLIDQPENENLEFKSSFRWDHKENKINKGLEKSVMKTIAAFLNSHGGRLVVGVDDKKNVIGVSHDYQTLPRPDADNFENHFSQIFHSMIGPEFRQFVGLSSHKLGDKEVCLINVSPSKNPVYLKSDGSEEFYIRTGNKTTSLRFSEAASYINSKS